MYVVGMMGIIHSSI